MNIRTAFTSRDVVDMARTGATGLGLIAASKPFADKDVLFHAAGEQ